MKAWWGLAASALSLLIIVLAYLAMVAGLPTAQRLSRDEAAPGIEVPVIGTVGDFPDPARRHVVNVLADGRIVVEGKGLSFAELSEELKHRAALSGEAIPGSVTDELSCECVLLRVDGGVPWGASFALVRLCSGLKIGNVLFAVRHETSGADGAVAIFSPTQADLGATFARTGADVRVIASAGDAGSARENVFAWLEGEGTGPTTSRVYLECDPALPTRTVMSLLDAALRAGPIVPQFRAFGSPPVRQPDDPSADFTRWTGARSPVRAGCRIDCSFDPSRSYPPGFPVLRPLPVVSAVRGRLAGVTWGHDHAEPRFGGPADKR